MDDPFDLDRFVQAQRDVYPQVVDELARGKKVTHWMWFVFPQLRGLGHSPMARRYAITSRDEARAYLAHPLLGPRLLACVRLTLRLDGCSATDVFGTPDDLKFRSCMTLFAIVAPDATPFEAALKRYFDGQPDPRTPRLLAGPDR